MYIFCLYVLYFCNCNWKFSFVFLSYDSGFLILSTVCKYVVLSATRRQCFRDNALISHSKKRSHINIFKVMEKFQASFLSLNVRGLNDNKKRRKIFSWCKKQNTDIVFLQETYSTAEVENIWTNEWCNQIIFSHGTNHARGVPILFKIGLHFKIEKLITDHNDGRFIYADLSINDSVFNILNICAPTADRPCQPNFFRRLKIFF